MLCLEPIDATGFRIRTERAILSELSSYFTFAVPSAEYHPAYRRGAWDGRLRLFNVNSQILPAGLYDRLSHFCASRQYGLDPGVRIAPGAATSVEEAASYLEHLQPKWKGQILTPHDFQVEALAKAMSCGRLTILSPTSSGKSLILYALARWRCEFFPGRTVIIVPNLGLITQLESDFHEYCGNAWAAKNVQTMSGKTDKVGRCPVIIATWQTLHKLPPEWFDEVTAVFGDECHLFRADSLVGVMGKAKKAEFRIGCTGTLDGTKIHQFQIEALFGPVHRTTTTKELMDRDIVSKLKIERIVLQWDKTTKSRYNGLTYPDEIQGICQSKARNRFLANLALSRKGNTLVLFRFVEHGKELVRLIKEKAPDRIVHLVYGAVAPTEREAIRQEVEAGKDIVVVASYATFATGISIRRLFHVIFACPLKSPILLRQAIGRELRKSVDKDIAILYDLADDLRSGKWVNYAYRHSKLRMIAYEEDSFDVHQSKVDIKS